MKKKPKLADAKRILAKVPLELSFWLCTNQTLRSLADVADAMEQVDNDVFRYHVNRDKNDFEFWIRDVIGDKELAREISRIKTKDTLVRKIRDRVLELKSISKAARKRKITLAKKRRKPAAKPKKKRPSKKRKPSKKKKADRRPKRRRSPKEKALSGRPAKKRRVVKKRARIIKRKLRRRPKKVRRAKRKGAKKKKRRRG